MTQRWRAYREAARLEPNYAQAHFNIAVRLAQMKQPDEAIAAYERMLEIRPDHVDAYFNLGFFLVGQRRTAEGVVLLQQRPGSSPNRPRSITTCAWRSPTWAASPRRRPVAIRPCACGRSMPSRT
jgi:tetratricopeptide (TPR) repeat protein